MRRACEGEARAKVAATRTKLNTEKKRFIYRFSGEVLLLYIYIQGKAPELKFACNIDWRGHRCHKIDPIRMLRRARLRVKIARSRAMLACRSRLDIATRIRI